MALITSSQAQTRSIPPDSLPPPVPSAWKFTNGTISRQNLSPSITRRLICAIVTITIPNLARTSSLQLNCPPSTPPYQRALRSALLSYRVQLRLFEEKTAVACSAFLKAYPDYRTTWIVDNLRRTDFPKLDRNGETYVDYME